MHSLHLLAILPLLSLPLGIFASPVPADPIVRLQSHYTITSAIVRWQEDVNAGFTNIDFDIVIRGQEPDTALDINCVGGVDVRDPNIPQNVQMNCPVLPGLEVWLVQSLDTTFDLTVQYLILASLAPVAPVKSIYKVTSASLGVQEHQNP
ncbi:MAG: hypothetical protein Q9169_006476 [Polycauliona sp. 2 TL-2023]